ncbi:phosphonate transport system substrate-binding protein [Peptoclostridium litorale DSM 5388]|uniref:Phosphate/phosphonate ABC transport system periplasmic phosphonate-binding protein n=1 Tax=Peptoclostridium litorale DSM 5388 TaxID=1121324 RepID=A0A069RFC0_PEPLI|nr:putative selenate ABC transporter substrate-binding protein [Peptoclostridium litorale]KDR95729.1 phosphate/phosphonate ABC transport system periplasmic phosphonate-binding protein [Peptoclostridium litorale DSM 5388]SIO22468.1 phosphonate transport system substrate-binding protein [Peptoclostridium litorale DSM 5388]
MKKIIALLMSLAMLFSLTACSGKDDSNDTASSGEAPVLKIAGIPDQEVSEMEQGFNDLATYLSEKTGLEVEYVPVADYSAVVTGFERGDIHLAWFGGLTGVQARNMVPDAQAIAQGPRDEKFHSVFIAQKGLGIKSLEDLKGKSFTFGSESSTSGHLMPRYFLMESGIDADSDFDGKPNYSGSHDKTYTLVESGAFNAGALNEAVWEGAVEENKVDLDKVEAFYTTPDFYDYNWSVNNLDDAFGEGTNEKIKQALLSIGDEQPDNYILKLLKTDKFIEASNDNYDAIEKVAKEIGIIK